MLKIETTTGQQVEITEESIKLDASEIPTSLIESAEVKGYSDTGYRVEMTTTQGGILTIPNLHLTIAELVVEAL